MTGTLVPTGVVTACCGGHRPAPGEASSCPCCAECVTNADVQARPVDVRAEQARADRERLAAWWPAARATARYAQQLLVHGAIEDQVRPLAEAVRHAIALPPQPVRPELPELEAACLREQLRGALWPGFTGAVPA
ncbi:hypothetical protein [Saccharothrix xinjiangensis]|uniref:Uncharacterized protein n=1 Tax=Saccharothrix xinjiangensis TaxID=204798 RepID=A0ABV9XWA9_9PSEU